MDGPTVVQYQARNTAYQCGCGQTWEQDPAPERGAVIVCPACGAKAIPWT